MEVVGNQTGSESPRVALITLGCSKNLVDSEVLYRQLEYYGIPVQEVVEDADVIILNTCGFVEQAKEESVDAILEAVALKRQRKVRTVIVAGCLSQRYKDVLQQEIPEVDLFVGTEEYERILQALSPDYRYTLIGERTLLTPRHYAYVKISEGCDHPCSFCAIPLMRGRHRSRPIEDIEQEVIQLVRQGVREVMLIAQDTTYYGKDRYGKRKLATLLRRLSAIPHLRWIRLHYAYPAHFPMDVLEVMAEHDNICRYLDIPLQHISDRVLKSMRRGITERRTRELIDQIRRQIPDIVLRTTFLVGYPNEREEDFEKLCDFVREVQFDRVGVFPFSSEEGTAAEILGDPIPLEEKQRRVRVLMDIQREIALRKNQQMIGRQLPILIDERIGEEYVGRTEGDSPEVDQSVFVRSAVPLSPGQFVLGEIEDAVEFDLFARCVTVLD